MKNEEGYPGRKCMKTEEGVLYIAKRVDKGRVQRANWMVKHKDCRRGCGW